ncbi:MAG: class I SAM-dependent methyltransferase [Lachnospiraceae bacterium]
MRDDKNEIHWDKTLSIRTSGRDDSRADQFRYPYEPTPYSVLERLVNTGLIRKGNVLLDYGCGKGRVDFFLSRQTRCRAIGIEYDERIWQKAEENRNSGSFVDKVSFVCMDAREFNVPVDVDRIYFFNPFSVEILQRVLARIRDSYYESMREILLFFYYPSEEYVSCLMEEDELMFYDEIDCRDLFPGEDSRERILIFEFI